MKNLTIAISILALILGLSLFSVEATTTKKVEKRCKDRQLSEKNFIQKCQLTATNRDKSGPEYYIKRMTFCRCIHRTFKVIYWADEKCTYNEQNVSYYIMNMSNNNMDVEEYCGHLRP
jgi:hypothetical protein